MHVGGGQDGRKGGTHANHRSRGRARTVRRFGCPAAPAAKARAARIRRRSCAATDASRRRAESRGAAARRQPRVGRKCRTCRPRMPRGLLGRRRRLARAVRLQRGAHRRAVDRRRRRRRRRRSCVSDARIASSDCSPRATSDAVRLPSDMLGPIYCGEGVPPWRSTPSSATSRRCPARRASAFRSTTSRRRSRSPSTICGRTTARCATASATPGSRSRDAGRTSRTRWATTCSTSLGPASNTRAA